MNEKKDTMAIVFNCVDLNGEYYQFAVVCDADKVDENLRYHFERNTEIVSHSIVKVINQ